MTSFTLSNHQLALIERPVESKIFLEGPAGTGKTTAGVGCLLHLLDSSVPEVHEFISGRAGDRLYQLTPKTTTSEGTTA